MTSCAKANIKLLAKANIKLLAKANIKLLAKANIKLLALEPLADLFLCYYNSASKLWTFWGQPVIGCASPSPNLSEPCLPSALATSLKGSDLDVPCDFPALYWGFSLPRAWGIAHFRHDKPSLFFPAMLSRCAS
jgi:hypothetical protein